MSGCFDLLSYGLAIEAMSNEGMKKEQTSRHTYRKAGMNPKPLLTLKLEQIAVLMERHRWPGNSEHVTSTPDRARRRVYHTQLNKE